MQMDFRAFFTKVDTGFVKKKGYKKAIERGFDTIKTCYPLGEVRPETAATLCCQKMRRFCQIATRFIAARVWRVCVATFGDAC